MNERAEKVLRFSFLSIVLVLLLWLTASTRNHKTTQTYTSQAKQKLYLFLICVYVPRKIVYPNEINIPKYVCIQTV